MDFEVDEAAIRKAVVDRGQSYQIKEDWRTPAGNPRTSPVYCTTIQNSHLDKTRDIKAQGRAELKQKAQEQIDKWKEQEIRAKVADAKRKAMADAESYWTEQAAAAKLAIEGIGAILTSSLRSSPVLDLNSYFDRSKFPDFDFSTPRPTAPPAVVRPPEPRRTILQFLIPPLWRKKLQEHAAAIAQSDMDEGARQKRHNENLAQWEAKREEARQAHAFERKEFLATQERQNQHTEYFIEQYEAGGPGAIKGYLEEVFANVNYPDAFPVEHEIGFDADSSTAVLDISLPSQDRVPTTMDYKFKKTTRTGQSVEMKPKDHAALYDAAIKQAVLRTANTAIASTKPEAVSGVVVNGWVTYLDKATGIDKTSCIISVSTDRQKLGDINLERVDPTECIKSLKGLIAGPMSQVAPVQPIFQVDKEDSRFVESQEVLAEINATTNLAEIGWEEFEHLVRELFSKMFAEQGAEVRVTQASSDGGVDAIAFDPDPIRGGKFVIQAKRYTRVVPVSAVRDLYGTMIAEGASKGILVTTAHYGRDTREFVKDKPISLIDGSNLVYLLEKHGHKVRIDVDEARSNRDRNPLAR